MSRFMICTVLFSNIILVVQQRVGWVGTWSTYGEDQGIHRRIILIIILKTRQAISI